MKFDRPNYLQWLLQVLGVWISRKSTKPRANLPPEFIASVLACIRTQGCLGAGIQNCAYWAPRSVFAEPDDPNAPVGHGTPIHVNEVDECLDDGKDTFLNADSPLATVSVCEKCPSPGVTMFRLSEVLFGKNQATKSDPKHLDKVDREALLSINKRVLRRFMHGGAPMPLNDFLRILANAYARGWLGDGQVLTFWRDGIHLTATAIVLKRFAKKQRAGSPKDESELDRICDEVATEAKILWQTQMERIALRIKLDHHWPADFKAVLLDAIREEKNAPNLLHSSC